MAGSATPGPNTPAPAGAASTATADGDRPQFATALRGYERNQVDDYLAQRDRDLSSLRAELADLRAERDRAVAEAEGKGKELLGGPRRRSAHLEPAAKEDELRYRRELLAHRRAGGLGDPQLGEAMDRRTSSRSPHRGRGAPARGRAGTLMTPGLPARAGPGPQAMAALQERERQISSSSRPRQQAESVLRAYAKRSPSGLREESRRPPSRPGSGPRSRRPPARTIATKEIPGCRAAVPTSAASSPSSRS